MPAAATAHSGKPILIVDDNEDIREALATLLETHGYATVCADNGATALDLLRNDCIDPCLVLLDFSMPVMDGAAFRRVQQSDPELAGLPVVLYSGIADPAAEAVALNVPHYFRKPLDLDQLVAVVQRHC